MMRSMFAGVSGTRAHQLRMDVIGNNIANVNMLDTNTEGQPSRICSQTIRVYGALGDQGRSRPHAGASVLLPDRSI